jgi:hypothetical protein
MKKPRTTDEKIDALTERIDALTQSVELLAELHKDNERRYLGMWHSVDARMAHMEDLLDSLSHIALNHDGRLRKLEKKRK